MRSMAARVRSGATGAAMSPITTRWVKLSRRLGTDGNPLRRRADKIEVWLTPAVIAVFLALCPVVGIGMGTWAHARNAAAERAELSPWHSVRAVLRQAAPGPAQSDNGANTWTVWAPARWSSGGQQETREVPVAADTPAGSTITVWLNRAGVVQVPPASASQVAGVADIATAIALAALAVLLGILRWLVRRALDRRRLADWESAWLTVGPRWSHRS
jgi:hypothetical protein